MADVALSARAAATRAQVIEAKVSDHLPQAFRLSLPGSCVQVLTWNIMARALNRQRAGELVTNNGLELDEDIRAYEGRLVERVAPLLAEWILEVGAGRGRTRWVACLQEAPYHAGELADLLAAVSKGCRLPEGVLRHRFLKESEAACNVTLWDVGDWELLQGAADTGGCAGCVLSTLLAEPGRTINEEALSLRVLNCHLPLPASARGDAAGAATPAGGPSPEAAAGSHAAVLDRLLEAVPSGQLAVLVGDFNMDMRQVLAAAEGSAGDLARRWDLAVACVPESAEYRGALTTPDALLVAFGRQAPAPSGVAAGESGEELGSRPPLDGLSREAFISKCINRGIQGRVRRLGAEISDEDLGRLGGYHFGDQLEVLERWLSEGSVRYPAVEAASGTSSATPMGVTTSVGEGPFKSDAARQDFIRLRIHRNLQRDVANLSDEELRSLGSRKYGEQFAPLQELLAGKRGRSAATGGGGGGGREAAPESNEAASLRLMGLAAAPAAPSAPSGALSGGGRGSGGMQPPPRRGEERVPGPGLTAWLSGLTLQEYLPAVEAWCDAQGAVKLDEVWENAKDIASELRFKPVEETRFLRAAAAAASAEAG